MKRGALMTMIFATTLVLVGVLTVRFHAPFNGVNLLGLFAIAAGLALIFPLEIVHKRSRRRR